MFGERYFATRDRLLEVVRRLNALATETETDLSGHSPLAEFGDSGGPPFTFIVFGEVNAGKSSLLNGLFGHDLCQVNVLPETKHVIRYRYGDSPRDVSADMLLEECYRPLGFLRDFNLIDTPGTNAGSSGHLASTEPFLTTAELILFVFPVSNPWGAATWNFISRVPAEALDRAAFILQQCDQRAPADIPVIMDHLRDLSLKRIGRVPPMFSVSAKLARDARSGNSNTPKPPASGYPALEDFISRQVCDAPGRRAMLENWRALAAAALRLVEDRIEARSRAIYHHGVFLEDVEREIDAMREQFLVRLPRHLVGVAEVFQTESVWVARQVSRRLGVCRSVLRLLVGDRTSQEAEAIFIKRLQASVEGVAETDGTEVVAACRRHWDLLGSRIRQTMGVELGAGTELDATLATARQRFVQRLGRAASEGIGDLKVRNQLGKDLHQRNLTLKAFTYVILLLLIAGGTSGALALPWVPWILCGLAVVFMLTGAVIALLTRRTVVADFRDRLLDTCDGYAIALRADYEEALRVVFQDYADCLGTARRHLAGERQAIEPRQRRWKELFLTLKAIEQDL